MTIQSGILGMKMEFRTPAGVVKLEEEIIVFDVQAQTYV